MFLKDVLVFFLNLIFFPIHLVGFLIPKSDKIWIFGSGSGNYYNDNSKYLFEFVSKQDNCNAIWLTKNKKILEYVRSNNKKCFYFNSLQGIFYSLFAKYIVISYSYNDVGYWAYLFNRRNKIIQLYHATPLKRIDAIDNIRDDKNMIGRKLLILYLGRKFDYMFSASDVASNTLNKYFNVNMDKYVVTGYPRNDSLFGNCNSLYINKIKKTISFDKLVLYLPTWRNYSKNDDDFNLFTKFGFNENNLVSILKKENAIFLIKLHYNDYLRADYILKQFDGKGRIRIIIDSEINGDIYTLLPYVDILITDYSSIYFDYLLLNRPIIFADFDREEYIKNDVGFYFEYDRVTPGIKVKNWVHLCGAVSESLKYDKYFANREVINKKFNQYKDGKSCERIFKYLKQNN
jgi:CDP-glycerol glycerophosphotransferase (TagB/SpsB family)